MARSRFTPAARTTLSLAGFTTRSWAILQGSPSATEWRGDACGCTDDRCIGHHHDESEACLCLPALIAEQSIVPVGASS